MTGMWCANMTGLAVDMTSHMAGLANNATELFHMTGMCDNWTGNMWCGNMTALAEELTGLVPTAELASVTSLHDATGLCANMTGICANMTGLCTVDMTVLVS
jgi:hypothetical protein